MRIRMMNKVSRLSWRDPDGYVFKIDGKLYRKVNENRYLVQKELMGSSWYSNFVIQGKIVDSKWIDAKQLEGCAEIGNRILEHPILNTAAFAHEITAFQLWRSAELTLEIALTAIKYGWILKDASAWNILYAEGKPTFIDVLSFSKYDYNSTWIAYSQFTRNFIIPLLLHKYCSIEPSEQFLLKRDPSSILFARKNLPMSCWWRLSVIETVLLPSIFMGKKNRNISMHLNDTNREINKEIFTSALNRLLGYVRSMRPNTQDFLTTWKYYEKDRIHYNNNSLDSKREIVLKEIENIKPLHLLDIGGNTGEYIVASLNVGVKNATCVDFDTGSLNVLCERILNESLPINTFIANIARPTPSVGWRNIEVLSLIERLCGQFDMIMMLGLMHHLIISERLRLPDISSLMFDFNAPWLLVEWIPSNDEKFIEVAGLNLNLYSHINSEYFESCFAENFILNAKYEIKDSVRSIYLWKRK